MNRSYQVVLPVDAVAGTPIEYGKLVLNHFLSLISMLTSTDAVIDMWYGR